MCLASIKAGLSAATRTKAVAKEMTTENIDAAEKLG
jgi:hypothetical protein